MPTFTAHSERIFVDSSFWLAFYNVEDTLHERAKKMARELASQEVFFILSNFIFLEVVTVLSQRVGKETALLVGRYFLGDPACEVIHVDSRLQEQTWHIFEQVRQKDVSFVDCSTVVVMRAEYIRSLLTFDLRDAKLLQDFYPFRLVGEG